MSRWRSLKTEEARALWPVRVVAHHAVQVVSALGATHLRADDSGEYANLGWRADLGVLVGRPVRGIQAGLRVEDLTWLVLSNGRVESELAAEGQTLEKGLHWLWRTTSARLGTSAPLPLDFDLPEHPVDKGQPIPSLLGDQLEELARWIGNTAALLDALGQASSQVSQVRVWPETFEVTVDMVTARDEDGEIAEQMRLGLRPGDVDLPEPYYFVRPSPQPTRRDGPPLPVGGQWRREGWFGAVLLAEELGAEPDQDGRVKSFLDGAVRACRRVLHEERVESDDGEA